MRSTLAVRMLWAGFVGWIPYVLVAAGCAAFGVPFWISLGVLVAGRALFALLDIAGGELGWRLGGKGAATQHFLAALKKTSLPPREYAGDGVMKYLARPKENHPDAEIRRKAADLNLALTVTEEVLVTQGRFLGARRTWAAAEAALLQYSHREGARDSSFAGALTTTQSRRDLELGKSTPAEDAISGDVADRIGASAAQVQSQRPIR